MTVKEAMNRMNKLPRVLASQEDVSLVEELWWQVSVEKKAPTTEQEEQLNDICNRYGNDWS